MSPFRLLILLMLLACAGSLAQAQAPSSKSDTPKTDAPVPQAQTPVTPVDSAPLAAPATAAPAMVQGVTSAAPPERAPTRLAIGTGDEIEMTVYGVPEMSQKLRVGSAGEVSIPLAGKITVAGLTSDEAQSVIEKKLADGGYIKNPHVTLYIKDYTTQGVSVLGEVARPGTYPALNSRRLYDVFLAAGGLTPKAGKTVTVTRAGQGQKPLVLALSSDPAKSADANVEINPGDTVIVSKAGVVYVMGEVNRAGGFIMENNESLTVLQAIAMANGPTRMANLNNTKMLRRTPEGLKDMQVPLKKILQAKAPDIALQPEDILFIPSSRMKTIVEKGSGSILSMVTSMAIYRF